MPSLPTPQQVAGRHLPLFEAYYKELDPNNSNNIGALAAAKFLKNSGLPDVLLSKIWDLSDPNATGSLTKSGLFVALKLVSLAQNNVDVSMANIGRDVPPPMMGDATVFPPNIPVAPSPLTVAGGARVPVVGGNEPLIAGIGGPPVVDWSMTPMEKLKYETLFESLQPQNGFIPGNKVKGVLMDSKLPTDTLGRIWDLADMDRDGCLDRHEFLVAMHLVYKALEKCPIPATLPTELLPAAKRKSLDSRMTPPIPPPAVPWVVSKEDQARYEAMFIKADADQDGFVNGPEIKHVFLSCNLPQPVLANIWSLADMNQVGKLNKEQFCLALWLVQIALKGNELPSSLTPEMVPPSMRGGPGVPPLVPAPAQPPPPPSNPEMDMISKDIAELSAERSSLENEVEVKSADITIRSGEIKSLQGELDALVATLRQLENQKIEAAKRLGDLKLQTGDINSELAEVESEIAAEQEQVDKLRTTASDQEALLSRQEQELHSKKQELESVKHEEHELEKKQKELNKKMTSLSNGLSDSQLLINQIQNRVTALEQLQRDMRSLIALAEEVEAKTSEAGSVPESLLSLEPEFKQEEYTRLVQKEKTQPNGVATDAFASSNGFALDTFSSTASTTQNDPFAAAFDSNGHDPFADSTTGDAVSADARFTKDPFGCDPFSAGGAPPPPSSSGTSGGGSSLSAGGHGHPPPRPESPSPALPPKKSKQPPPRPAPPRPSAPTQPVPTVAPTQPVSAVDGFADFDNFNSKAASTLLSSPFSTSSAYSSSGSFSSPHHSVKSPPHHSSIKSPPGSVASSTVIGRPVSRASSLANSVSRTNSISSRTNTPGFGNTSTNTSTNSQYPPLSDFTDDPFKDYRYEDPFNIVDPFSDEDRPASTLPARTKPDGSPAPFDPFLEARPSSTQTVGVSDDMFANDPFFASASTTSVNQSGLSPQSGASQKGGTDSAVFTSNVTRKDGQKGVFSESSFTSTSGFGDFPDTRTFDDPFFSASSTNGSVSSPSKSDPFKSVSSSNGFGDPFSFSSQSGESGNKFADDNFDSMFAGFDANGKLSDVPSSSKAFAELPTSSKPLTDLSAGSAGTKSNGVPQGSLRGVAQGLPSEDEQLEWAATESLRLETEKKLKERQERADLELAMKLSQSGESFPVKW